MISKVAIFSNEETSGVFRTLSGPSGAFVKLASMGEMIMFMETASVGFETYTYWGMCQAMDY